MLGNIPESPDSSNTKEANMSQKLNFFKETRIEETKKKSTKRLKSPQPITSVNKLPRSIRDKKLTLGVPVHSKSKP
jgi:hypothetical protein